MVHSRAIQNISRLMTGTRVTVTGDLDFHYRIKYDQLTYEAQSAAGVQVLMEDWEILVQ